MNKVYEFQATESLSLENSFVTLKKENDIKLHVSVGIKSDTYGWFEIYDELSGGEEWYAEGAIRFDEKKVTDYDGVFSLPICVINKLREIGYDTSEIE